MSSNRKTFPNVGRARFSVSREVHSATSPKNVTTREIWSRGSTNSFETILDSGIAALLGCCVSKDGR